MKHIMYLLMAILVFAAASLTSCGYNELGGHTPVAVAGPDQNVKTGSLVMLDGSGSNDADPDTLSYSWFFISMPDGSEAILSGETTVNPTFIADVDGNYILSLVVNDGILTSAEDTVTIISATDNSAPVANAGPGQNVETDSLVTLDGSGSSDANGDALTYFWAFSSLPAASIATLSDETAVNPTFTADLDGSYVLNLVVNDGSVDSAADDVIIMAATANSAPTANAGPNQNVTTGATVTLDGSGSSDANGDTITYSWAFSSRPDNSTAILSDPTTANPSFTADLDGSYVLTLIVNDGQLDSTLDVVLVIAATDNSAPVANAGADQNVTTGTLVTLDGSGSSDADLDPLTYDWTLNSPVGSGATLSDPTAENPTFTADLDGTYVLSLVVNDGYLDSSADVVLVIAATDNSAPVANAGADQNVTTGALVALDGSGSSDADLDPLTYGWSFSSLPPGSGATLSDPTVEDPTFTADLVGAYVLNLIVNDGYQDSTVDVVLITAATDNSAPDANAGADQNVDTGTLVILDGSGSSDADLDPLTYGWSFSSFPVGSGAILSDPTAENPTFTADLDGSYVLNLVVNDGTVNSAADAVTIIAATPNSPPIADAGADQPVSTGATVTLDGSGSSDPDDDPLTYKWTFTSKPIGSTATLSDATAEKPTFAADLDGPYVLSLVVNDGSVDSAADSVIITAATPNSPPVADAGADQPVSTGATVTLDGSGSSDPDDYPLTYKWTFTSKPIGSAATLSDATAENPTFPADLDGLYILSLVVNDGSDDSTADEVIITASNLPPVAEAGPTQNVTIGTTVILDGSRSSDPNNDILTYSWSFIEVAGGVGVTLTGGTTATPSFTAINEGTYSLELIVSDGTLSDADSVTINSR